MTEKPVQQASDGAGRKTVLIFVRYYLPGGKSGPSRSIANMVTMLGDAFAFRIIALDHDVGAAAAYPGVRPGEWHRVEEAEVRYLTPGERRLSVISRILRETPHDLLYLNSFFDPVFTIVPLLARTLRRAPERPCMIAVRGEFASGALAHKRLKKQAFLLAARGLYGGLIWQATNPAEIIEIRTILGPRAADIRLAPNIGTPPARTASHIPARAGEPLRICFLSRISPKKNLTYALAVLEKVRSPVRFDIYGPLDDPQYWEQCQPLIARLPGNVRCAYKGAVEPAETLDRIARYDLFFLPTLGENFGHAINEALCAGTPALIADTTPWRNLAASGAGWDLPLARPELFTEAIEALAGYSPVQLEALRRNARAAGERGVLEIDPVEAMRQLLHNALGRQPPG